MIIMRFAQFYKLGKRRFPGLLLPKNLNMEELKYEKIIFIKKRQNEILCMPV